MAREWWKLSDGERQPLLDDPWAFKGFVAQLPVAPVPSQAERAGRTVIDSRYQTVRYTAGSSSTSLSLQLLPLSLAVRELQGHQFDASKYPSVERLCKLTVF